MQWSDNFFSFATNEISLEDRCLRYWNKYFLALAETMNGELLLEEVNLNVFRENWLQNESRIKGISKSKGFVEYTSLVEKCLYWCANVLPYNSIPNYNLEEIMVLADFPETF